MREITKQSRADQRIAVFALAIFICVFLGPFDTSDDLEFWDRVVFWSIAISVIGVFMEFCITAAIESRWLRALPSLFQVAIGSAIGSVPGTAFVITLNKVFRPDHLIDVVFPVLSLQVTIMAILIAGLAHLVASRSGTSASEETSEATLKDVPPITLQTARLAQRLPTRLREGQIISMSMQDHYVNVATTLGSEMILMRMADAIDLLDGIAGVHTHRSPWAAQAHSNGLTRVARRHTLTLSDGRSIPVSSSYRNAVEQMLNKKGQA